MVVREAMAWYGMGVFSECEEKKKKKKEKNKQLGVGSAYDWEEKE